MSSLDLAPGHPIERLLAGMAAGPDGRLADLYTSDAVVELPFAQPGGLRLVGRPALRAHFDRAGAAGIRLRPVDLILHRTTNPTIVIAEYDYECRVLDGPQRVRISNVQIFSMRGQLIAGSRDFHDHVALAAAMRM